VVVKNVPEGMTPRVSVDEVETPAEVLEQALRVDPGHHRVTAQAGTARGQQEVDIAERESKEVAIELPAQEKDKDIEAVVSPAVPSRTPEQLVTRQRPAPGSRGTPALFISGFSVGGVGLLTGIVTGLVTIAKTNAVKRSGQCQDQGTLCDPSEASAVQSARSTSTVSDVAFLFAGAGAAAGVVGLFIGRSSRDPSPAQAWDVEPWVGLGAVGLSGRF
jgi:hypothetical protein